MTYATTQAIVQEERSSAIPLVRELCNALAREHVVYCHWKSNDMLERSASGDNDLDLLVSRADGSRFLEILHRLGFKQAWAPAQKQVPAVLDFFGYDPKADKWVHVHTHFQLVLGHDFSKNYRLPIEEPYLDSAVQNDLFPVPAPEFEFIVFVIRMAIKHFTWDVVLGREGSLKPAEQRELAYLQARIDAERVDAILKRHLPYIGVGLFEECVQALGSGRSTWKLISAGKRLQKRLQVNGRRRLALDIYLKLWRRVTWAVRRRVFKTVPKYRLAAGGAMIAFVGGDGAGKSTAVDALQGWLSKIFEPTTVHMGKPGWSWGTIFVRGILKIGNLIGLYPVESSFRETLKQKSIVSPGYPWLLREVCQARDRYRTYVKARRLAANGGLVILDRFPHPRIEIMDGPQTARFIGELAEGPEARRFLSPRKTKRFAQFLVELEQRYYAPIVLPELLIVLRVEPEIAVQRKTDEDATSVRERNKAIWEVSWEKTDAHIIEASKPAADVLTELKALIWREL